MSEMPGWTADKLLKGAGAGADPVEIDVPTSAYSEGARVYHSVAQSIADITWTILAFDSEDWDTDGIHDTVTNNSRLTCQTAGKYVVFANIGWAGNSTGSRFLRFWLNGATWSHASIVPPPGLNICTQVLVAIMELAVGDYVEVKVYQDSGGALDVSYYAGFSPVFGMQRIG
jgi:hypothetical protein